MINTYYVSLQKKNNLALLFQSGLPIIAPCFKMPMAKKECNICKTQVVALPRHMKQIHMQNTHTADCNHCGKLFSSNRVKEHIRSVHGPATFGCDFCDKIRPVESKSLKVGKSLKIGNNRIKSEKSELIFY